MSNSVSITTVAHVDLVVGDGRWAFADANRAAIEENFARARAENPALFSGALYLLEEGGVERGPRGAGGVEGEGDVFRGTLVRVDYASFLYWTADPARDTSARNVFGSCALITSDGALILGIMGAHTAHAGQIYPPSGSPEDQDMAHGRFDVDGNIAREIAEETGISVEPGESGEWLVIDTGPRVALTRRIALPGTADEVVRDVERHLAREAEPELAGLHVVRGPQDIVPGAMPDYTLSLIARVFGGKAE